MGLLGCGIWVVCMVCGLRNLGVFRAFGVDVLVASVG